jgi:hypothetical protein
MIQIIKDLASWDVICVPKIPPSPNAQQLRDLVQLASDQIVFGMPDTRSTGDP